MKAAVCYEFGKPLVVEEVRLDPPQAGEVKAKIVACAICHSDVHWVRGEWGGTVPVVAGHEAAGVITEIGPGVTRVKVGDPVVISLIRSCGHCFYCTIGRPYNCEGSFAMDRETRLHTKNGEPIVQAMRTASFAEYVVVDQSQTEKVPADLPLDRASLLGRGGQYCRSGNRQQRSGDRHRRRWFECDPRGGAFWRSQDHRHRSAR